MAKRAQPVKPRVLQRTKKSPANPVEKGKQANGEGHNAPDLTTFHIHVGEIKRAQATVLAARKVLKTARRAAADAGLQLGHLDLVLKMAENEPETVESNVSTIATYAHWMGLAPGFQGDLFKAAADSEDEEARLKKAEHEGYVEGLEAGPGMSPTGERYDASTETGQARLNGWNRGQSVVLDRIKPLDPPPAKTEDAAPEGATVQ